MLCEPPYVGVRVPFWGQKATYGGGLCAESGIVPPKRGFKIQEKCGFRPFFDTFFDQKILGV